ncbi:glycosyltransferase family 4 protein [Nodosilinea sp. LEGE 07088]|uniref:glycosyltransferase family 4 protein n=1 Tax=Nodosilinea sp. LEGE 07088 TaxID=2777968 RepID=UPI0018807F45|nr:glycosyltransferase family 4 protein [Nodosilinea sp. LEGE 07088]MBE9137699.1 glycosyltransferase family 4 protein [Nodosilinea sp. LEGE 07088]
MKIAVVGAKGLPPLQGGIEHQCSELYPRIQALGHQVDFFARASYTSQPWFHSHDYKGIRVISLPAPTTKGSDALASSALAAFVSSLGRDYDVIHFHALGPALFASLPKLAYSRAKVVVTCHGLDWQRSKWGKIARHLIRSGEQMAVKYADSIVVVSKQLQQYFQDTYGYRTVYIPNAPVSYEATDESFTYGASLGLEKKKYIIFLGRLVPEKRLDILIQAFKSLPPSGWKLVIVGGNSGSLPYVAEISRLVAKDSSILFTGLLGGAKLAELMRGAGLFVLPSDVEGLPLAMLEAMSEGVPVVASDIEPHRELLGKNRGLLFDAGSVESCKAMIAQALVSSKYMESLASNAQQYVLSTYNWDRITRDNLEVYRAAIEAVPQTV